MLHVWVWLRLGSSDCRPRVWITSLSMEAWASRLAMGTFSLPNHSLGYSKIGDSSSTGHVFLCPKMPFSLGLFSTSEYFMEQYVILRNQVQTLLSDKIWHTGDFKRSYEMDVSNKNTMFNLFLPRISDVAGTLVIKSSHDLVDTHDQVAEPPFWRVQIQA